MNTYGKATAIIGAFAVLIGVSMMIPTKKQVRKTLGESTKTNIHWGMSPGELKVAPGGKIVFEGQLQRAEDPTDGASLTKMNGKANELFHTIEVVSDDMVRLYYFNMDKLFAFDELPQLFFRNQLTALVKTYTDKYEMAPREVASTSILEMSPTEARPFKTSPAPAMWWGSTELGTVHLVQPSVVQSDSLLRGLTIRYISYAEYMATKDERRKSEVVAN